MMVGQEVRPGGHEIRRIGYISVLSLESELRQGNLTAFDPS
jgi:hypothetical protein